MTPEAEDYLVKVGEDLRDARKILGIGLGKAAARGAYYVAFHAAEALLIERTGRIAKAHSGLRTALAQVLRDRSREDRDLLTFLGMPTSSRSVAITQWATGRSSRRTRRQN